jgi:lipopolysaccharide transport system ATP-binding protein
MNAVENLCHRAIWLSDGHIKMEGQPPQVVSNYLQSSFSTLTEAVWDDIHTAPGNDQVRLLRACVRPEDGSLSAPFAMNTDFTIEVVCYNLVPGASVGITLHFYNEQGIIAFGTGSGQAPVWYNGLLPVGLFRSVCHIPGNLLNSGRYRIVLLAVSQGSVVYRHEDLLFFDVRDSVEGRMGWYGKPVGVVHPSLKWTTEFLGDRGELTIGSHGVL